MAAKKKSKTVVLDLRTERIIKRKLRYMDAENLVKDFKTPGQRKAMAAVFEWIGLNGLCARRFAKHKFDTAFPIKDGKFVHALVSDAIVIENDRYEQAREILGLDTEKRNK